MYTEVSVDKYHVTYIDLYVHMHIEVSAGYQFELLLRNITSHSGHITTYRCLLTANSLI